MSEDQSGWGEGRRFRQIAGALAESWVLSPDLKSITFKLRKGAKSYAGNELNADALMWSFERGWNLKQTFYWYMTVVLKVKDYKESFTKIDDYTVKVSLPNPSPLLVRIWVNNDLGVYDAVEVKKHVTSDDPWGNRWLGPFCLVRALSRHDVHARPRGDF